MNVCVWEIGKIRTTVLGVVVDKRTAAGNGRGVLVDKLGATLLGPVLDAGIERLALGADEEGDVEVGLGRLVWEGEAGDVGLVQLGVVSVGLVCEQWMKGMVWCTWCAPRTAKGCSALRSLQR